LHKILFVDVEQILNQKLKRKEERGKRREERGKKREGKREK